MVLIDLWNDLVQIDLRPFKLIKVKLFLELGPHSSRALKSLRYVDGTNADPTLFEQ